MIDIHENSIVEFAYLVRKRHQMKMVVDTLEAALSQKEARLSIMGVKDARLHISRQSSAHSETLPESFLSYLLESPAALDTAKAYLTELDAALAEMGVRVVASEPEEEPLRRRGVGTKGD